MNPGPIDKRWSIRVALVAILVVAFVFLIWSMDTGESAHTASRIDGTRSWQFGSVHADGDVQATAEEQSLRITGTTSAEHPALGDSADSARRLGNVPQEPQSESGDIECFEICCVSADGAPVGGLQLDLRLSFKPASKSESPFSKQFSVRCDAVGRAVLQERKGCRLSVVVQQPLWRSELFQFVFGNARRVEINVYPGAEVRVRAMFDDGMPFTGAGDIRCSGTFTCVSQFRLDEAGTATVPAVPLDMPLTCTVYSHTRPGYDSFRTPIGPRDVADQREILVVIPKSRVTGGIHVTFTDSLPALGSDVLMVQENGWPQNLQLALSQKSVQWGGLSGGFRYRVVILGEFAWMSDWILVTAGEVSTVSASLTRCGAIRARIVDDSGLPVPGAVLRISDGAYLTYKSSGLARSRPGTATANADGSVELHGVPAGRLVAEAEAWGREVSIREITVGPGAVVDLDNIVLPAAHGSIEVELIGQKDGIDYHVTLLQPAGPPILDPVSASGGRCTFSGLPMRKYVIAVTPGKYGSVASQKVELIAAEPTVLARIDVSGLQQPLYTAKRR